MVLSAAGATGAWIFVPWMSLLPVLKRMARPWLSYPEECWFSWYCVDLCPLKGKQAIRVVIPLPMRVSVLQGK